MKKGKQNVEDDQLTISQCITKSPNSVSVYSDPIPFDLLIDIFSRVTAKSIARFRCVSKFWASILRRPDFTELFLTKSLTRPRFLFSFQVNGELLMFSAPQPQNLDENSSLVATRYKTFPKDFPSRISYPLLGLVSHRSWGTKEVKHVICNPVTGEFITLPEVNGTNIEKSYFGFDPINKEFKVLCLTSSHFGIPNAYEILTLDTGERLWRTIQEPIFPQCPFIGEICINGVLYYRAFFKGSYVIVTFDVRSEKFGFINLDKDMPRPSLWTLFNYKGKLGAHQYRYSGQEKLVLWILEDARKHKWSKIICLLPPINRNYEIAGMTSTGEIVFSPYPLSNPLKLFYYNVERKTFTTSSINGFEEFKHHKILVTTFVDYVENMKFI